VLARIPGRSSPSVWAMSNTCTTRKRLGLPMMVRSSPSSSVTLVRESTGIRGRPTASPPRRPRP
jgi:hypothetical protein